jgi:hypothetical protein
MTFISSLLAPRLWHRYIASGLDAFTGPPADPRFLELAATLADRRPSDNPSGVRR